MTYLAESAFPRNAHIGLDHLSRVYRRPDYAGPDLTPGGAVIARRVQVSASVANLMAEVAGIGGGAHHV